MNVCVLCVYNIDVNHKASNIFKFVCKTGSSSSFVVKVKKKNNNPSQSK